MTKMSDKAIAAIFMLTVIAGLRLLLIGVMGELGSEDVERYQKDAEKVRQNIRSWSGLDQ